jgi:signal transduction histidine kinase
LADVSNREQNAGQPVAETVLAQPPERLQKLARYLESRLDQERAGVARELHDALGGLLVAAEMDLSHLEHGLGAERSELRARLARVREYLDAAVATQRRMVEQLQPGLLVHVGLFAALRWYLEDLSVRTGRSCRLNAPSEEVPLPLAARVSLFRAVQEGLELGLPSADCATEVTADIREGVLQLGISQTSFAILGVDTEVRLLAVLHRVTAVDGELVVRQADGLLQLTFRAPLGANVLEKRSA